MLYLHLFFAGTTIQKPDYLATVDVDPNSPTFSKVIHRLPVPYLGDELHHSGWNSCSSCHGVPSADRRFLVLPSLMWVLSNLYIPWCHIIVDQILTVHTHNSTSYLSMSYFPCSFSRNICYSCFLTHNFDHFLELSISSSNTYKKLIVW